MEYIDRRGCKHRECILIRHILSSSRWDLPGAKISTDREDSSYSLRPPILPSPSIVLSLMSINTSQESTSQKGKSAFSIFYSPYKLTTILGQWGYVGKPPPLSSTTSSTSSTASASRASSTGSRPLLATARPPLLSTMPPRARPASRPDPGPESPATSSQRPILGVALPTSFSFLKRETV